MVSTRIAQSVSGLGIVALLGGCVVSINSDDDTDTDTDTNAAGASVGTETGDDSNGASSSTPTSQGQSTDDTAADDSSSSDTAETEGGAHDDCDFTENFDGIEDGAPWPDYWFENGGVAEADVRGGRGRLQAVITGYSLARMGTRLDCDNVDASVTFEFTDGSTQGVGLYARTNGGYLQETNPTGEGYAAFAELFRNPGAIGAWREVDGEEQLIDGSTQLPLQAGVQYRMRFRLTQQDDTTSLLQGKIWPLDEDEPAEWTVERTDQTASLQNAGGGVALDAWSLEGVAGGAGADLYFDDLVVTRAE